jgi:hypothetical protein
MTGEWKSCGNDCPVFGKDFDELARMVIGLIIGDKRKCANCGRSDGWNGCGEYVENCMQNYDAYSNWIPKDNIKEDF